MCYFTKLEHSDEGDSSFIAVQFSSFLVKADEKQWPRRSAKPYANQIYLIRDARKDADDEAVRQTAPARVKTGHSTSGSSSSDDVPDPGIGISMRTQSEGSDVELNVYKMHILIQPPVESRPGSILRQPTVVSLRKVGVSHREGLSTDINGYWAFVSVVSEDGMVALAPPSTSLISGTIAVHEGRSTEAEEDVGHLEFPNLAINQTGRFRLRISLLQMLGSSEGLSVGESEPRGVKNIASVVSDVIHVKHDAAAPQLGQSNHEYMPAQQRHLIEIDRFIPA